MNEERAAFDPAQYERLSTGSVPGYAALQELVAFAVAATIPPSGKILDLGCGTGAGVLALSRVLPDARLVACDPVDSMVAAARVRCEEARAVARFYTGAIADVPSEAPFDAIVCTLVLQFVPAPERGAFLRAILNSLRPGGVLVMTALAKAAAPDEDALWGRIRRHYAATHGVPSSALAAREAETRGKVQPLSSTELAKELAGAGFQQVVPLYQLLSVHTTFATR